LRPRSPRATVRCPNGAKDKRIQVKFSDLDLLPRLLENVSAAGYTEPTPIQQAAIPPALEGRDVLGTAQTGTGKTAAFSLPILQRLDQLAGDEPRLRALILTPTRELAAQIDESLSVYGKGMDLWNAVVFGGISINPQIKTLRDGVDALVATPGRLLDLLQQRALSLKDVQLFVLDEADRMLDMGFLPDVKRIIAQLPRERQTLFFSATMPPEIRTLADTLLKNPAVVSVDPVSSTAERVEQRMYFVDRNNKRHLLVELLKDRDLTRTLVFTRTKHGANRLTEHLLKARVKAAAIHGNKSQGARVRALEGFKRGELSVLVATDVAARGIDVDGVSHVVNYDLPNIPETYVHRIGRTGRAGASGIALSFCEDEERPFLVDIERLIGLNVPRVSDHGFPPSRAEPTITDLNARGRPAGGGGGGGGGQRRGGQGNGGQPGGNRSSGHGSGGHGGRPHGGRGGRRGGGGGGRSGGARRGPPRVDAAG
jgi:ATP-dependent RNA helicase RhlE